MDIELEPAIKAIVTQLIAQQPLVPASPGRMVDDAPLLCLAACVAEACFIARGDETEATAFRQRAARATDKSVIYEAFDRLGWSRDSCAAAVKFNDSLAPAVRKQRILEMLADA